MKQILLMILVLCVSSAVGTEVQEINRTPITTEDKAVESTGCSCDKEREDCGCCAHIKFDKLHIHIDDDACVNITYLPQQYGIALALTWNDKVVFNKTVSASNPPPICIGVPHIKLVEVCVRLYNISYSKHFGGCIALEFEVLGIKEDIPIGCIYKNSSQIIQNYEEMKENVIEMKKNFEEMKQKTRQEVKKWDYLLSEKFYGEVKTQVFNEVDNFRNVLSEVLSNFKGKWLKQEDDENQA